MNYVYFPETGEVYFSNDETLVGYPSFSSVEEAIEYGIEKELIDVKALKMLEESPLEQEIIQKYDDLFERKKEDVLAKASRLKQIMNVDDELVMAMYVLDQHGVMYNKPTSCASTRTCRYAEALRGDDQAALDVLNE